jgi:hypothetical protein
MGVDHDTPAGSLARDTGAGRAGDGTPPGVDDRDRRDSEDVRGAEVARGVEFVSDVLEFPWGYVAQFHDPDGNRLQIREGR